MNQHDYDKGDEGWAAGSVLRDEDADTNRHQATGLVHRPQRRMKSIFYAKSYG